MEPRAHHVLIGLFTVIAVTAALSFALWLHKGPPDIEQRHYLVIFNETVRGLAKGSAVQYNGIKIGEVVELQLDPQDPRRVLARIRIDGNVPIKRDIKARQLPSGLTGTNVIELSGGAPDSPELVAEEGRDPVIVAAPSPVKKLFEQHGDLAASAAELAARAQEVLSPANLEHFSQTLANLERASGALASQDDNIRVLIQQLTAASRQANSISQQASRILDDTHSLVDNEATHALGSAERAMASLEKSAATLDQLLLDNRTALSGGFSELGPALREFRETLASIRRITRRLEDNPAAYLTGREKIEEIEP